LASVGGEEPSCGRGIDDVHGIGGHINDIEVLAIAGEPETVNTRRTFRHRDDRRVDQVTVIEPPTGELAREVAAATAA
jgi:phosphoserine phosphatase